MIGCFDILKIGTFSTNVGNCPIKWVRNQMHRLYLVMTMIIPTAISILGIISCDTMDLHEKVDQKTISWRCLMNGYLKEQSKKPFYDANNYTCHAEQESHYEFR